MSLRDKAQALVDAIDNVGIVANHDTAAALHCAVGSLRAELVAKDTVSVPREPSNYLLAEMDKVQRQPTAGYWQRVYDAMLAAAEKER